MRLRTTVVGTLLVILLGLGALAQTITPMGEPSFPSSGGARGGSGPLSGNPFPGNNIILGSIRGTVTTVGNRPLDNVRIDVHTAEGGLIASGYTGKNGAFELQHLPFGDYLVVATLGLEQTDERVSLSTSEAVLTLHLASANRVEGSEGAGAVSVNSLRAPEKAKKAFRKAQQAVQRNHADEARREIAKALEAFPTYADALALRGVLNLQEDKIADAMADLEQAIQDDYSCSLAYMALGSAYNGQQKFADAIRVLERGVSLAPISWQAHFELARAEVGQGNFSPALRQVLQAEQFGPKDYSPLRLVKAQALLGTGDYAAAAREYEAYLSLEPNGPNAALAREELRQAQSLAASEPVAHRGRQ